VVEPAGAVGLAGLIKHARDGKAPTGDCVVTISGANVNFDRIGHIVEARAKKCFLPQLSPNSRGPF